MDINVKGHEYSNFVMVIRYLQKKYNDSMYKSLQEYDKVNRNFWTMHRIKHDRKHFPNITLYYCLLRKNSNYPIDCLFYNINEFLNWLPAGCWKSDNLCIQCSCPRYLNSCDLEHYYYSCHTYMICSWNCLEKKCRSDIELAEIIDFNSIKLYSDVFNI